MRCGVIAGVTSRKKSRIQPLHISNHSSCRNLLNVHSTLQLLLDAIKIKCFPCQFWFSFLYVCSPSWIQTCMTAIIPLHVNYYIEIHIRLPTSFQLFYTDTDLWEKTTLVHCLHSQFFCCPISKQNFIPYLRKKFVEFIIIILYT